MSTEDRFSRFRESIATKILRNKVESLYFRKRSFQTTYRYRFPVKVNFRIRAPDLPFFGVFKFWPKNKAFLQANRISFPEKIKIENRFSSIL